MWYVNTAATEIAGVAEAFYINYVVCKFGTGAEILRDNTKFYINYVVCK